ncbi:thioredoxin family protein [Melioribacter sp. OK-6-Me]|uniref:thioredoxin family protein n=1 Tax=unclassified Melioribacter TaxID=2627329 RepID=UPI003EDB3643
MTKKFFLEKRPHNGMTYEEYMDNFRNTVEMIKNSLQEIEDPNLNYLLMNFQRSQRIEKNYVVNEELCNAIKKITAPQLWMVLTEYWCGDSAQTLPYINKIAKCSTLIELKILERDKNLDIMDLYLTNGTRSIPKLVAFDYEGNELFQWGPRPGEAQDLIKQAKENGKSKEEFMKELHLWYGRNRGKAIEEEFKNIINNLN